MSKSNFIVVAAHEQSDDFAAPPTIIAYPTFEQARKVAHDNAVRSHGIRYAVFELRASYAFVGAVSEELAQ